MEKFKGTQGEWTATDGSFIHEDGKRKGTVDINSDGVWLADCKPYEIPGFPSYKEALNNAKLISAAPDLLDALQTMNTALMDLIKQLPNDESLADYRLDYAELAQEKATKAISKALN